MKNWPLDQHSLPGGGGNQPNRCFATANKQGEEEALKVEEGRQYDSNGFNLNFNRRMKTRTRSMACVSQVLVLTPLFLLSGVLSFPLDQEIKQTHSCGYEVGFVYLSDGFRRDCCWSVVSLFNWSCFLFGSVGYFRQTFSFISCFFCLT